MTVNYIQADIKTSSLDGPLIVAGNFIHGATKVSFKGGVDDLTDKSGANFNIYADSFNFDVKGSYTPGDKSDIKGKAGFRYK